MEACTKDGEKENKKQKEEEEGTAADDDDSKNDDLSSPMSDSTRCFKYMMPWIDCASKYRNLYTLIELDTNYTEGIEELEATSSQFCWLSGQEPKIDWTNWEARGEEEEENKYSSDENGKSTNKTAAVEATADITATTADVALWKTLDPALGDPKVITVEAKVPATISSGLGILECAYAVDQDNKVIGFAYGTKPSDLIGDGDGDGEKAAAAAEGSSDDNKDEKAAPTSATENDAAADAVDDDNKEEKMIPLNIRIVASRTREFVLAASYTHRIVVEGAPKKSDDDGNDDDGKKKKQNAILESHLYKSHSFALADVPKRTPPPPPTHDSNDVPATASASVSP